MSRMDNPRLHHNNEPDQVLQISGKNRERLGRERLLHRNSGGYYGMAGDCQPSTRSLVVVAQKGCLDKTKNIQDHGT